MPAAGRPHEEYGQSSFYRSPTQGFRGRSTSRGDRGSESQGFVSTQQTIGDEMVPSVPAISQRTSRTRRVISPSSNGTSYTRSSPEDPPSPASLAAYDIPSLTPLQIQGSLDGDDLLEPVIADESGSFDLLAPSESGGHEAFSLENRMDLLISTKHLEVIFAETTSFSKFVEFLGNYRPGSVPVLAYFLGAKKALKAISYANAIASETLRPIEGCQFSFTYARPTVNSDLEEKASCAFEKIAREDLPAYITHIYIQNVRTSITRRITGTLTPHLREASEGLAEVFCLTDPSRPDNPIVFASEEFHHTTQYGMSYVLGRNCRFLQGPKTDPFSVRYFIGAQIDVSGLVKECTGLESLERLVNSETPQSDGRNNARYDHGDSGLEGKKNNELQDLCDMLDAQEQESIRKCGFCAHKGEECIPERNLAKPRPILQEKSLIPPKKGKHSGFTSGKLAGPYQNYLLVRPFPSLRILFASPSLRVPGILQSSFISKIGGSTRVRDELTMAMADGRGVTAKVVWISKAGDRGRPRWIHCTPLFGSNGQIGVWMIVIIDDDSEADPGRWRQAPPVPPMVPVVAGQRRNTTPTFGDKTSPRNGALDHSARSDRNPRGDFQHPTLQPSFSTYGSSLID
ncbi:MAG: hypothetical protein M1840_001636 [Geoglossum simile]|nr:MAG: hypothetical protein M1840_001636 [Geoglossum simile]